VQSVWQGTRSNGIPILRGGKGKPLEKFPLLLQRTHVTIYPEKKHEVEQGLTPQKYHVKLSTLDELIVCI